MMKTLKIIFSVLVALVLTVFSVKNSHTIAINLWPFPLKFNLALSLVLIGTFTVGAISGGFLVWVSQITKRLFKDNSKHDHDHLPRDL